MSVVDLTNKLRAICLQNRGEEWNSSCICTHAVWYKGPVCRGWQMWMSWVCRHMQPHNSMNTIIICIIYSWSTAEISRRVQVQRKFLYYSTLHSLPPPYTLPPPHTHNHTHLLHIVQSAMGLSLILGEEDAVPWRPLLPAIPPHQN